MKQKLLFVTENLVMGGVTRVLENLLKNLDFEKYQVDLLVLHYCDDMPVSLPPQVNILKGDRTYQYIDQPLGSILKKKDIPALCGKVLLAISLKTGYIKHIIRRSRAKLLTQTYDTEIAFSDGFPQVFVAQGNTPRKVAWLHADISVFNDSARYEGLIGESLGKFDAFACVSGQVKAAYQQQFGIQNAHVIHNIMDAEKIRKDALAQEALPFQKDTINLISVGRLCEAKNYVRFIRAHKRLRDAGYPVRSYVVGDGADKEMLQQEIAGCNAEDSFFLLGRKNNPFPYVKNADLFVLSSNHEGLPTVLFEALILGTPCVSTNVAGAAEILGSEYGIITEVEDDAFYEGIVKMLTGKTLASYQDVVARYPYSTEKIIQQIEDIL